MALIALALAGCASVADTDRAWIENAGEVVAVKLGCPPAAGAPTGAGALAADRELSVISWNIHRNADPGWEHDLGRFAAASDLVLLQEATLTSALREVLMHADRRWTHADAWAFDGINNGVLTAAATLPAAACVQRAQEPLLGLPKSALVAWYRIEGRSDRLAVANVHAINFTLELGAYQKQLDAVVDVLASHRGPVILAGDFNTWSPVREQALVATAARIGLVEARPRRGERSRFLGMTADYLFVRGLGVDDVWVETVDSSDHAPIRAKLKLPPA
ncbi:MAG TPA: endonuclease/exonuclease/phosphatase family protein [Casimicrobiaceae bacterium]|nr:endonuclease/exonuclease/phosphatase family protein [Casimicrobiaceae bacterium]